MLNTALSLVQLFSTSDSCDKRVSHLWSIKACPHEPKSELLGNLADCFDLKCETLQTHQPNSIHSLMSSTITINHLSAGGGLPCGGRTCAGRHEGQGRGQRGSRVVDPWPVWPGQPPGSGRGAGSQVRRTQGQTSCRRSHQTGGRKHLIMWPYAAICVSYCLMLYILSLWIILLMLLYPTDEVLDGVL